MGCNYSNEITGTIPNIHFGDEKKHPYLKEVMENKTKKPEGFFLINRRGGERHDYVVLKNGEVIRSSKDNLIGRIATIKGRKWKLWYNTGYTRLYYPTYKEKSMEIFQGSPQGKIHGFFIGPNGPSGASLHYGPGGVYTLVDKNIFEVKDAVLVTKGKTVSILIDGFPILVEKQSPNEVKRLLEKTQDQLDCESY